ncbi:MAG: glycosyltransferase [Candidatus Brocadiia bacterium]
MRISVLITTFNRARLLRLCLLGYLRQNQQGFEIIISDDGSTDATQDVVEEFQEQAPFPVTYIWREHRDHRRAEVINRAIAASQYEWLVFSDSDSIPHQDMVRNHRRHADSERLLCGGRIRLNREVTEKLTPQSILQGAHEEYLTGQEKLLLWKRHLKNLFYIAIRKERRPHNYGLNMSCSKEAMIRINGYDHNFIGWGNADGNVRDRMRMLGIEPKSIVPWAPVFHQWHPTDPTRAQRRNLSYARRDDISAKCENGLDSLQGEDFWHLDLKSRGLGNRAP